MVERLIEKLTKPTLFKFNSFFIFTMAILHKGNRVKIIYFYIMTVCDLLEGYKIEYHFF